MAATMTSRERLVTAARRQPPDRVPRIIEFEGQVAHQLAGQLGIAPAVIRRYFQVDMDFAFLNPTQLRQDFSHYFTQPNVQWDAWGCGRLWDATHHYAEYLYPLVQCERLEELEDYPWPDDMAPYRYVGLDDRVATLHAEGQAVFGALGNTIFETAWQMRSMERLFEDMLTDDPMAVVLLDHITERRVAAARAYAHAGVDVLHLADDVAMQTDLLMSRELFCTWLAPRYHEIITAAREIKPDILIHFHSDGDMSKLFPDLIQLGIDIQNPVQPECVDHHWAKTTYGDALAFSGGLGVQSILPFGTPEQVRHHTRETIETLGAGGGLIIGPAHLIERDIPLANFYAMIEAIDTYGAYT